MSGFDDLPLALSLEFSPETSEIDLNLYEHVQGRDAVPLNLKYQYAPEVGFAPSQSPTSFHSFFLKEQ